MSKDLNLGLDDSKMREIFFFFFFIPWIAFLILNETTFSGTFLANLGTFFLFFKYIVPLVFVLIKLFLFDKMKVTSKLLLSVIIFLLLVQLCLITIEDTLYYLSLGIVAAYGINFKKILKVYLWDSVILVIFYTSLAIVGIIPNAVYCSEGVTRYAFGSIWCTDYSAKIFFMILICLYLYSKRMKWFHWILLCLPIAVVFYYTRCKLDLICNILSVIVFYLHEYLTKKDNNFKLKVFWNCCLRKLSVWFTPIAVTVITLLTLAYSPNNALLEKINLTITERLRLGKAAFSSIGLSLFGSDVRWIGKTDYLSNPSLEYNFVDCSYLHLLFKFGIVATIIFISVFVLLAYRNRMDLRFVLVVALVSLNCVIAHHFIDLAYNPFWLILFADVACMQSDSKTLTASDKQTDSEIRKRNI